MLQPILSFLDVPDRSRDEYGTNSRARPHARWKIAGGQDDDPPPTPALSLWISFDGLLFATQSLNLPQPDPAWTVTDHVSSYLFLDPLDIEERARRAVSLLGEERCDVCPRLCKVGRLDDERGLCGVGRRAVVASYFPQWSRR